jgi:2-C-methyl-D-erythritol 4-phosphate cytidylyltransferase
VVAAGRGVRFGRPKQLIEVAGRPLVAWSFAAFGAMDELADLVVATEAEHVATMEGLAREFAPRLRTVVVCGGKTRQQSVENALAAVPAWCDAAFVHDGARPLVCAADVRAGMAQTEPGVGALLATPVIDTVKVVATDGRTVARTLQRSELWAAQTPQFGMLADLRAAHARARREGWEATDDAMLLERAGARVVVVPVSGENFKVTLPGDRILAEAILRERALVAPR